MSRLHQLLSRFDRAFRSPSPVLSAKTAVRDRFDSFLRAMLRLAWVVPALLLATICNPVHADCYSNKSSGGSATTSFTPPTTITVPVNTPQGTVIYTSGPLAPSSVVVVDCYNNTGSGIYNSFAGQPSGSDNTLFPTNIPWLSYRILHPDTTSALRSYPNQIITASGNGTTVSFSVASALQLVTNGQPITYTNQLSGALSNWALPICTSFSTSGGRCSASGLYIINSFSTSTVKFVAPACTVVTDPTTVTLPTVQTLSLPVVNSTSGQTPFAVRLTCASGQSVSITLATSAPAGGVSGTGVIAPTASAGQAQGVGVQILDKNANQISFGTPIPAGTAGGGPFAINFYARYYRTGATISPGNVSATATYTLTYQ
jgi:type 1 fimbria pilin